MEHKKVVDNLTIENAKIAFKNFSGAPGKYNAEGMRNFCVFLDGDVAKRLADDNWNIRWLDPRDPQDEPQAYMQIKVQYGDYPPKITVVTSKGKTVLTEETIGILDWAEITNVDMIIRPYNWEVSGKTGVKGYVKTMWVTLYEDELEKKYSNVPDSAAASILEEDAS